MLRPAAQQYKLQINHTLVEDKLVLTNDKSCIVLLKIDRPVHTAGVEISRLKIPSLA